MLLKLVIFIVLIFVVILSNGSYTKNKNSNFAEQDGIIFDIPSFYRSNRL